MQPQGWERRQSEEVHTSDERETFLQSNSCKPQADFICVHFSERFGFLPVTVLRRRSGYKPAAYTTTHLSESLCIMALNHYIMVLYTQATHLLYIKTYQRIICIHCGVWICIFFKCSESRQECSCWELQKQQGMTHKDESDSILCMRKLILVGGKTKTSSQNLGKLISTSSFSLSLIHTVQTDYMKVFWNITASNYICVFIYKQMFKKDKENVYFWREPKHRSLCNCCASNRLLLWCFWERTTMFLLLLEALQDYSWVIRENEVCLVWEFSL